MSKYDALDKTILSKIGSYPQKLVEIYVRDASIECRRLSEAEGGKTEPFRIFDRRLQALRKKGTIKATNKGWIRTEVPA